MFKIGSLKLENNLCLAPMAGVTNASFRLLCKKHGAGLVYSPLMDEDGIISAFNRFNDFIAEERPIGGQIVGANPIKIAEAAKVIEPYVDLIDLNFGCPDNAVLAKKAGAYHVKHPDKIDKIIRAVKEVTSLPVTAKIRIGWDNQTINHIKVSKIIEDAGADAIAIHGRTKEQGYSGKANWNAIKQVKEKLSIPVIGNGDANSPQEVKRMIEFTNCDAVMIGRAALGNPWIFNQSLEYLKKGGYTPISAKAKMEGFIEYLELYKKYQNRDKFSEVKTHALWFSKGLLHSTDFRGKMIKMENEDQMIALIKDYIKQL